LDVFNTSAHILSIGLETGNVNHFATYLHLSVIFIYIVPIFEALRGIVAVFCHDF